MRRRLGDGKDLGVVGEVNGLNGQAHAALSDHHIGEDGVVLDDLEGDGFFEMGEELDIDGQPAWVVRRGLGVKVIRRGDELSGIWVGGFGGDGGEADDAGRLAIGVIEEDVIALVHGIAHEVAGLIITHALP